MAPSVGAGIRLRGGNLNPGPQHARQYDLWAALWHDWDWSEWIQPLIDDLKSVGGNALRVFGNTLVVTSGAIDSAAYLDRWRQLLDYTAALDMSVLPCGGDLSHWGGNTTWTAAEDLYGAWARLLAPYDNVIGLDVTNEASDQHAAGTVVTYSQPEPWYATITHLGEVARRESGKPITHSRSVRNPLNWRNGSVITDAVSDFISVHCYYAPGPNDPVPLRESPWGAGKSLIIGEFGASASDSSSMYGGVTALVAADAANVGALVWPTYDISGEGDNALFYGPGEPQPDQIALFQALPDTR